MSMNDEQLIKVANKYNIKKEIYYSSVDPYLNIPTDRRLRPMKMHSGVDAMIKEKRKN